MFQRKTSTEFSRFSISIDMKFFILMLLIIPLVVSGQENATDTTTASQVKNPFDAPNMPRRALLYSAILPGLGQFYNKEYWKVPLALGGFVTTGWMINLYNEEYTFAKDELFGRLNNPDYTPRINITEDQLRRRVEVFNRERDYMMVITAIFYLLQIMDAHIDSHLKDFDENPNMEVKLQPSMNPVAGGSGAPGLGIALKF